MVSVVSSGDMPAVGSSRISNSGLLPKAMAISNALWSPWAREPAVFPALSERPTLSRILLVSSTANFSAG
jgi:hypothetical protein